jgi:hypothetical protein
MNSIGVQPLIYLIDPAFTNPHPSDQRRFEQYPENVIVVPEKDEVFYKANPELESLPYPVVFVSISNNTLPYRHLQHMKDIPPFPTRGHFDLFDIVRKSGYDPITNSFTVNKYNLDQINPYLQLTTPEASYVWNDFVDSVMSVASNPTDENKEIIRRFGKNNFLEGTTLKSIFDNAFKQFREKYPKMYFGPTLHLFMKVNTGPTISLY